MRRYEQDYEAMEESAEGEWVKADEAMGRIADLEAENAKLKDTALYGLFKKWMITAMELKEENRKLRGALKAWTQSRTHTCASPEFMELMRNSLVALGGEG
jgi:hypothetical protein